ncbi:hypothetical protein HPB49_005353 [Dermacentor silvarum]|uniref:Uncharacterized protein n=1 Tax=Dermacentor silvarum TaxID=543639 RepID=A0ACB8DV42_DERSI|nr:hypothetical protein HPB49_005353 [Dermacentor silvarum]
MSSEELNSSLSDDLDELRCSQVVGTLCFSDAADDTGECFVSSTSRTIRSWSKTSQPNDLMASAGDPPSRVGPQQVVFEIVSAKTVVEGPIKQSASLPAAQTGNAAALYVGGALSEMSGGSLQLCRRRLPIAVSAANSAVKKEPGLERLPGVLERRYSDFSALFAGLRRRHPSCVALRDFPFPRKALLGNFTTEVITERSLAFRHLLSRVHASPELRRSPEFAEFTWRDGDPDTFTTLAVLTACLNAVDNVAEAQKYAELALSKRLPGISASNPSDLEVPLLVLAIRLWWAVGKEKRELEERLRQVKDTGVNVDALPTLLELVLKKDSATLYSS